MITNRIIVTESSGRWAIALRSILGNSAIAVIEVGTLAKAFAFLREDSRSLLAFEASHALAEEGLRLLVSSRREPGRRTIVLLDDATADSESLWYESGAVSVVSSPRHLASIAGLVQRHFETHESEQLSFREAVWKRMPWHALGSKS